MTSQITAPQGINYVLAASTANGLAKDATVPTKSASNPQFHAPRNDQTATGNAANQPDSLDVSGFLHNLFALLIQYGSDQREQRWQELGAYEKNMKKVVAEMHSSAKLRLIGGMANSLIGLVGAAASLKALNVKNKAPKLEGLESGTATRRGSLQEHSAALGEELSLAHADSSLAGEAARQLTHGAAPHSPKIRRERSHSEPAIHTPSNGRAATCDIETPVPAARLLARAHSESSLNKRTTAPENVLERSRSLPSVAENRSPSTHATDSASSASSVDISVYNEAVAKRPRSLSAPPSKLKADAESVAKTSGSSDTPAAVQCNNETAESFDMSARIQKASTVGNTLLNLAQNAGKILENGFEFAAMAHDAKKTEDNAQAEIRQSKRQIANEDLETARSQLSNAADVGNSLIRNRSFLVA